MSEHEKAIALHFYAVFVAGALVLMVPQRSSAATPTTDAGNSQSPLLQEVIVTAQRRSQSIQEVPGAVTAITANVLQSESANGLEDYFHQVPSLAVIPGSEGTMQLSIRGINSAEFTGPTVGVYVDDTPIGTTVAGDHANELVPDLDPSDLERVEVLQGPQGTLYGAANMGGLIKFVTTPPSLTEYSGRMEVDGSGVDHGGEGYVVRGAFTGPIISDKLGLRISAFSRRDPGFFDDPGSIQNTSTNQDLAQGRRTDINSARVYGGHASALWEPSSALNLRLSALYQDQDGDGQNSEDIDGLTQKPLYGDLTQISSRYTGQSKVQLQVYNATLNWDLNWATLLASTSDAVNTYHSVTDITGLVPPSPTSGFPPAPPLPAGVFFPNAGAGYFTYPTVPSSYYTPVTLNYRTGKVTEEVRLTSPSTQTLEWLFGLFYTHEATRGFQEIDINDPATGAAYPITGVCAPPTSVTFPAPLPPVTFPPCTAIDAPAPPGTPFHQQLGISGYTEYSEYGDLTYHVTSRFSVQGGIRLSKYRETFDETYDGVLDSLSTGVFSAESTSPSDNGSKLTYLASLKYQVTPHVMAYTRFATGYRPGGANEEAVGAGPRFGPDLTKNYEVGIKSTLDGGRLVLDEDGYFIDWQDIQLKTTTPMGFTYYVNGRSARSAGAEADATFVPVDGLTLRADASYNNAVLRDPIPASASVAGGTGDRLPYSPEWSGTLSADYSFPLASGWRGHFGGDYDYTDAVFDNFYPCTTGSGCETSASLPPNRVELAPYSVVNLRAGITLSDWSINLFVKNAFDKRAFISESVQHATYALAMPNGQYIPDVATVILPGTVGLSVVREF